MADLFLCLLAASALCSVLHIALRDPSGPVTHATPRVQTPAGPEDTLTPAELVALASLATRYAHSDPRAGRCLADYLRTKAPGVSDADLMRCVVALASVARWFNREHLTATDALAGYLHALGGAALDFTQWHREDVPR